MSRTTAGLREGGLTTRCYEYSIVDKSDEVSWLFLKRRYLGIRISSSKALLLPGRQVSHEEAVKVRVLQGFTSRIFLPANNIWEVEKWLLSG